MTSLTKGMTGRRLVVLAAAGAAALGLFALGAQRSEAATNCPGTFKVLHNDHIGSASKQKRP